MASHYDIEAKKSGNPADCFARPDLDPAKRPALIFKFHSRNQMEQIREMENLQEDIVDQGVEKDLVLGAVANLIDHQKLVES